MFHSTTDPKTVTPRNDVLALFGLQARPLTLWRYNADGVAETGRMWDAVIDRAAEKGWSPQYAAGLVTICFDIIRGQHDEALVMRLAPMIDSTKQSSPSDVVARAEHLLTWLLADRVAVKA